MRGRRWRGGNDVDVGDAHGDGSFLCTTRSGVLGVWCELVIEMRMMTVGVSVSRSGRLMGE